jgi:hypothetical protein
MGVTLSRNGILSHERLSSEEGAQDHPCYEHDRANSTQAERKIIYSVPVHIPLRFDAEAEAL